MFKITYHCQHRKDGREDRAGHTRSEGHEGRHSIGLTDGYDTKKCLKPKSCIRYERVKINGAGQLPAWSGTWKL